MSQQKYIVLQLTLALVLILLPGCTSVATESTRRPDKQIIVLWHTFTGIESQALQALTDQFNAGENREIILITEYQQDILGKIQDADLEHRPDLVVIWPRELQAYMTADFIAALPDLGYERADMLPMASALYTVNGTMRALPLGLLTYLMYYNANWLADLGYTSATATWEDWQRIACAATDPVGGQVGIGLPAHAGSMLALLTAGGSEIVDAQGYFQFADKAGLKTATVLNAVLSGPCGVIINDADTGVNRLSHSSMAMLVESSLRLKEIERAVSNGRNFKLDVAALPGSAGPGPTLWYGPGMVLIASQETHRDAAHTVIEWFYSTEAQTTWSELTHYLPVRRSLIAARLNAASLPETEKTLLDLTLTTADNGTWVAWPRYVDNMACRASLLRGLLALKENTPTPGAYIDIAVTACNTGVKP